MAIHERTVKNKRSSAGELTGKAGTVYDVNIKYKAAGESRTYSRKGFPTKQEAQQQEAEMKAKLTNASYTPPTAAQRKLTVQEYMTEWLDRHDSANLRPSTYASYKSHMKNHIFPCIGSVFLSQLTPAMLDDRYWQLSQKDLSQSSVRYATGLWVWPWNTPGNTITSTATQPEIPSPGLENRAEPLTPIR